MARRLLTTVRLWQFPLLLMLIVTAVMSSVYLGGNLDPQGNLHHYPIGLVVAPQTVVDGQNPARSLDQALKANVDSDAIKLTEMTSAQADHAMDSGKLYGAIVIPADFNASVSKLLAGTTSVTGLPAVEIETNPRAGTLGSSLTTSNLTPLVKESQQAVSPASFTVQSVVYRPLPAHTALGSGVFYYALLMVMLGFIGVSAIGPFIDGVLGFSANEIGPKVTRRPVLRLSRVRTLLVKAGMIVGIAPIAAFVLQAMAAWVFTMPVDHPVELWLFGTVAIAATGLAVSAVFAIFGGLGSLVSMILFVALALTASAGTLPPQASPWFFRVYSHVDPMYSIVRGCRAILYFPSASDAGLVGAWVTVAVIGTVVFLLGLGVTAVYDRNPRLDRHLPLESEVPS